MTLHDASMAMDSQTGGDALAEAAWADAPSPGTDAHSPMVDAATTDAAPTDAALTDAAPTDAAKADAAQSDAAATDASSSDAAMADAGSRDAAAPPDPCGDPPLTGGCGGRLNFCVVPDAGTASLADGGQFGAPCEAFCGMPNVGCTLVEVDAQTLIDCWRPCTGRLPTGLQARHCSPNADFASYLQEVTYLEAASVSAFGILGDDLRYYQAPLSLVRAARRAAREEARHARMMGTLARAHGAACRVPRVVRPARRTLAEIAIENAIEGCVRETYGACVAVLQSRLAQDSALRATMKSIAKDEANHAALAWKVDAWIHRRLSAADRRRVALARRQAVEELADSVVVGSSSALSRRVGIPGPREASAMVAQMRTALWQC